MSQPTVSGKMTKRFSLSRFLQKRQNAIVDGIASLFILLFVYTAISKFANIPKFENALKKSPLIESFAPYFAWGIPAIEVIITLLLFIPTTKKLGLYASLILMTGFTIYLGYMIYYTPDLPCSCGGVISQMSWREHLVFNIAFTALALAGVGLSRKPKAKF